MLSASLEVLNPGNANATTTCGSLDGAKEAKDSVTVDFPLVVVCAVPVLAEIPGEILASGPRFYIYWYRALPYIVRP